MNAPLSFAECRAQIRKRLPNIDFSLDVETWNYANGSFRITWRLWRLDAPNIYAQSAEGILAVLDRSPDESLFDSLGVLPLASEGGSR